MWTLIEEYKLKHVPTWASTHDPIVETSRENQSFRANDSHTGPLSHEQNRTLPLDSRWPARSIEAAQAAERDVEKLMELTAHPNSREIRTDHSYKP